MVEERVHLKNIIANYKNWEKELVTQLTYEWKSHGSTIGENREEVWKSLFERIIPKKFHIARSVFIIDSKRNCSREVDLAIYDEQYTPYIFNYGVLKFVPIEAVAAVIECKSSGIKKEKIKDWLDSFKDLKTSQEASVRIAGRIHHGNDKINSTKAFINTQTETRPIKILCRTSKIKECFDGFDITMGTKKNKEKLQIIFDSKNENLMEWYLKLNHNEDTKKDIEKEIIEKKNIEEGTALNSIIKLKDYFLNNNSHNKYAVFDKGDKIPLLSFIFEFNQLLMLINNPIFFPHRAYVNMFNDFLKENADKEKNKK
ncbi:hypothetical protein EII29_01585 [Leptotrichia sp. OH3620_COT-345]|uniref:DUF6602 domain-containing protein n=1 Tax=Leptotrichia sp. OH3620_COT-345 TaxID=2491048 RepID=UPI000F651D08|nr:DUF6602 domain-containing protein [Leptotrichia sp. OH3620_COT-345]RRD40653.1 hypothetical protein EII29_01585 [Leptotrichia sp. OH3620_COT-345]